MKAIEIRQKFLEFFESKQHLRVTSAPLVIKNDPTLMFTNAGMNQFKDYFLGNKEAIDKRVANSQKCLRVSGKHNDLEEVGIDTYHHTMFEMLGNWSFGDYFKKEAIDWAWELLTEVYDLPKDRIYVSVFEGSKEDGLERDNEASQYWEQHVDKNRIINGNKKDNFWEMGETGPCGPCSELHIDLRPDEERAKVDGKELVNQDDPLVIEVWNLVFMQFNRKADGSLEELPDQHVDTGMGFERLCMAIQQKTSNYDTDVFQPMIQAVCKEAGVVYGKEEKIDIALRVVADHIRAIAFAIADGQLPSNNKAGYVIRRILRRAVRYGYTFLEYREPFMYKLVAVLSQQMGGFFPEIKEQEDFIAKVIKEEEASFLRTLENGLKLFDQIVLQTSGNIIDGKTVFELNDTYGFPLDLTALIARERGLEIDEKGFHEAMKVQKERSKADAKSQKGDWIEVAEGEEVEFIGYDHTSTTTRLLKYREVEAKKKTFYQLVLEETPFYAEGGGQVGDRGYIEDSEGNKTSIKDTVRENNLFIHIVDKLPKVLDGSFKAVVNTTLRSLTENNHSATHLLHAALKQVLGNHVAQKGSLVNEKILRFDFSHFTKITDEELAQIEKIVNGKIRENIALYEQRNVAIEQALESGATALFGEKYGDFVRVITFDKDYSVELCGGTHVKSTGQIGLLKITSESSVASGVRRIEAVSADKAEELLTKQSELLKEVKELLKQPKDLSKAISTLIEEKNSLQKKVEDFENKEVQLLKNSLLESKVEKEGVNVIVKKIALPSADKLRQLAFEIRNQVENLFMVLAVDIDGKPQIGIMISEELVESKGYHAGNIIRDLAKEIKGGGGGQAFFATAGGKDVTGLDNVVAKAKDII